MVLLLRLWGKPWKISVRKWPRFKAGTFQTQRRNTNDMSATSGKNTLCMQLLIDILIHSHFQNSCTHHYDVYVWDLNAVVHGISSSPLYNQNTVPVHSLICAVPSFVQLCKKIPLSLQKNKPTWGGKYKKTQSYTSPRKRMDKCWHPWVANSPEWSLWWLHSSV